MTVHPIRSKEVEELREAVEQLEHMAADPGAAYVPAEADEIAVATRKLLTRIGER